MSDRRVVVVGLDCATPQLVFDRYRSQMPVLSSMMERGCWAKLRSTQPPITVPAWTSMVTGRDPGELGLYGFRNRVAGSYDLRVADSTSVRHPRLWERLGDAGKRVCTLFVPPSHPPSPVNGQLVSCFLTPGSDRPHTYPETLGRDIADRFGPYIVDVDRFRSDESARVLTEIYRMTEQHFGIARDLWQRQAPDFMMLVDMGVDRFHHAFWHHIDPEHPRFEPDNPYADEGARYYGFVDAQVGSLLEVVDDDTTVLVVSDHGARPMLGGFCINEWLIERGDLVLNRRPTQATAPGQLDIDWTRTRAWAEGGYYGRLFVNVKGREPTGLVAPEDRGAVVEELVAALSSTPGPGGEALEHRIETPERSYRDQQGLPPDISVFFGDLAYRCIGSVGTEPGAIFTEDNDTGPDGCNHDWDGIFVMTGPGTPHTGDRGRFDLYDVNATVLSLMGVEGVGDLLGVDRSDPA